MKVVVTGAAGFIGYHVSLALLNLNYDVVGIDNLNNYYDVSLKEARLKKLQNHSLENKGSFKFYRDNIADNKIISEIFSKEKPSRVINLAAQAGVRYSKENPLAYVESNIVGFTNILEACRNHNIEHLVYASTSSVYGANTNIPFSEHIGVDHPLQFYAATKRANELMAHSYSHLYKLPTTGLRFFTAYGPWGRPDMALFIFTKNIIERKPIKIFNFGNHTRDFTYIDDIVEGIIRVLKNISTPNPDWNSKFPDPSSSNAPYRIYNIGNNSPIKLTEYISALENSLGIEAIKEFLPLQDGDTLDTYADISALENAIDFKPNTSIEKGINQFVKWYMEFYSYK